MLPGSFKKALNEISKEQYFHRYPVFWQWFAWLFGAFILKDYEENELQLLSEKTGIPRDHIPNAIAAYEKLFPLDSGWFADLSNSNIRIMKMFPIPFMGIGANYRRFIYAKNKDFRDLQLSGDHTHDDLIKWNNLAFQILSQ